MTMPYLKERLLLEMTYNNEKVIVSVIYCSPGKNNTAFDLPLPNFEKLLSDISKRKPSLFLITGDFNARFSSWWPKEINTTKKSKLFLLTSSNELSQLIAAPTHVQTSSSSWINLIFTDQPNLSVNSGVHASLLSSNCHYQIALSSFNLNIS